MIRHQGRPRSGLAGHWASQLGRLVALLILIGCAACSKPGAGSPEAVADAFCEAYFRHADQQAAKRYTAFGASKMLDLELADVQQVRKEGFSPGDAKLNVTLKRGERSARGHRARFQYTLTYAEGDLPKYADIELSKVHDEWKVVRVGLSQEPPPADSAAQP